MHLEGEIRAVENAGCDMLHLDIMDGHFVPNITFGPFIIKQINEITDLPLDVHLMIENPSRWIDAYVEAGADIITIHTEACTHIHRAVQYIKSMGIKASVSLNPATNTTAIEYIAEDLDMVLVMSVNPGFGGQKYIKNVDRKIKYLDELRKKNSYNYLIEVDGGVNTENVDYLSDLGVDVFVAGSAVFKSENYSQTIKTLKNKRQKQEF